LMDQFQGGYEFIDIWLETWIYMNFLPLQHPYIQLFLDLLDCPIPSRLLQAFGYVLQLILKLHPQQL